MAPLSRRAGVVSSFSHMQCRGRRGVGCTSGAFVLPERNVPETTAEAGRPMPGRDALLDGFFDMIY
jgi:hypothetical protein